MDDANGDKLPVILAYLRRVNVFNKNSQTISRKLGRHPVYIDSALFTAMHRPRLYTGNLLWGPFNVVRSSLNEFMENDSRRVRKIKASTVTTQRNSTAIGTDNLIFVKTYLLLIFKEII